MREFFFLGQNMICFFFLTVMVVSVVLSRRRDAGLNVLLSGEVLLLAAVSLRIISWGYKYSVESGQIPVIQAVSGALTVAALLLLAVFFFLRRPRERLGGYLGALVTALVCAWFGGLAWVITREVSAFPGASTVAFLIARSYDQRSTEAELKRSAREIEQRQALLLQEQIRPHFTFNSLTSIRELCETDPALAGEALDNLAGFLRKNMDALTARQLIPFERELEHIEQYVALEKLNPSCGFEVVYDLRVMDFLLPALSIQPLVENAIHHGVRNLGSEGLIVVSTEQRGEFIRIAVEDNGEGFPKGMSDAQRQRISHGLENVRRRLETQCGGSLHMRSPEGGGVRAVVLIPKRNR